MSNEIVKYHNDLNTIPMRKWTAEEMNFFFAILAKAKNKGTQLLVFDTDELKILQTKKMEHLVKKELGVFDYRDYLFEDDLSIYLLLRDLSVYDNDTTIIYRSYPGDCDGVFNGTVIFTKMDEYGYVSLNENDIDLILKHLHKLPNSLFEMRYSIDDTYQLFEC